MLLNYHIGRLVLSSLCVGDLVRLVLGGVRFPGFSLQNEHHLKPAEPEHRLKEEWLNQSSLNLCTGRPPTGVMIPDAVYYNFHLLMMST